MVNAQEWLDKKYPKETRMNIKKIETTTYNSVLENDLDLNDFANLEELIIPNNTSLKSLNIKSC